ncbi:MAG: hypothetical protein COB84_09950 [Rhodobacteraceae bacterium]|nr:MAG: hypothetical protein COB84_09950 [Paracoccaceae bacterium]
MRLSRLGLQDTTVTMVSNSAETAGRPSVSGRSAWAALKLGRSEMLSGGRKKIAILGDGMEAVIAAVYQDAGFEAAKQLILRLWKERIETADDDARDPKTTLQEWAQAQKMPPPKYVEITRSGPDHAPVFEIEAQLDNGMAQRASATSKRNAQQLAAAKLLEKIEATT